MAKEPQIDAETKPINIGGQRVAAVVFDRLFIEGMALVEHAAAYLDGEGRQDSRALARPLALAYATESMRLTTRLMKLASWLLVQRAVNQGEMSQVESLKEREKFRYGLQGLAAGPELFRQLPPTLQELCAQSLRLQQRIQLLDDTGQGQQRSTFEGERPVEALNAQIRAAFGRN